MSAQKKISAGLAFIQAASAAMPRTLGDRERIFALCDLMSTAVNCRFAFDKDDARALYELGIETCVGVFRPLDYYTQACCAGGTYARMWEAHYQLKPWMASRAIITRRDPHGRTEREIISNNRVAPAIGVLLPVEFSAEEEGLASLNGEQVWWCTSMDNDTITLCRYRVSSEEARRWEGAYQRTGQPAKRRVLTREQWAHWNPKPSAQQKEAA